MSSETPTWIVFDCPACGRPVKMPERARGTRMACPVCAELIAPGRVEDELPEHFSRTLPAQRHLAPPPSVRAEPRENWEPGHPDKRAPVFESTVSRIGREVALTTAEEIAEREQRRTKIRRRAMEAAAPSWESEEPTVKPRRSRRHRRRIRLIWAGSAAFVLSLLIMAVLLGRRDPPARTVRPVPDEPPVSPAVIASGTDSGFAPVTEADYAGLGQAIEAFVAAKSPQEALPLVRDQARVGRVLGEYWRDHPLPPSRVVSISPRTELVCFNGLFCGFAELSDYNKRVFAMEKTPDGRFLLDWESYTGWCEVPWEALPRERPRQPVLMRAQVRSDDYFNHQFNDPAKYACFRLSSLDQAHQLYGYIPIATPLVAVVQSKTKFSPLVLGVLKIRYPDDPSAADNQVEITAWVCDGWVLRE